MIRVRAHRSRQLRRMECSSLFKTRRHIILLQNSIRLDLPSCQRHSISLIPYRRINILLHLLLLWLKTIIPLIITCFRGEIIAIAILIIDVV